MIRHTGRPVSHNSTIFVDLTDQYPSSAGCVMGTCRSLDTILSRGAGCSESGGHWQASKLVDRFDNGGFGSTLATKQW